MIQFGFWKKIGREAARKEHSSQSAAGTTSDKTRRPIFVLAPMADVTDEAFRAIIAKYGKPDVTWTEFVSADGLCSAGREVILRDLAFSEAERPIVAQLFTSHPEKMFEAAKIVASLGFDGIDINMGCPDRSVEKQGAGANLIKTPELARDIIEAARRGAPDLPVSVKTRIGYNKVDIECWIGFLLRLELPVLTVHLRTRKEMSDVPAHWDLMPSIVKLRDDIQGAAGIPEGERTIILGNGDAADLADARVKAETSGADGVMLGRAIFGNPWLFEELSGGTEEGAKGEVKGAELSNGQHSEKVTRPIAERLRVMVEHTFLFENKLGDIKNFAIMKKHYKAYVNGWEGAKELRLRLMEAESAQAVADIVEKYISLE